jgi:hypothetical protein
LRGSVTERRSANQPCDASVGKRGWVAASFRDAVAYGAKRVSPLSLSQACPRRDMIETNASPPYVKWIRSVAAKAREFLLGLGHLILPFLIAAAARGTEQKGYGQP